MNARKTPEKYSGKRKFAHGKLPGGCVRAVAEAVGSGARWARFVPGLFGAGARWARFVAGALIVCGGLAQFAHATSGPVNGAGCHGSGAVKHCHPERVKTVSGGETVAQRDRRLFRECKGRSNAGACLGRTGH